MNSDVDIGTLPISEWRFSVQHICLRYRNNRCRCRCRISPKLRSMSMPTYAFQPIFDSCRSPFISSCRRVQYSKVLRLYHAVDIKPINSFWTRTVSRPPPPSLAAVPCEPFSPDIFHLVSVLLNILGFLLLRFLVYIIYKYRYSYTSIYVYI